MLLGVKRSSYFWLPIELHTFLEANIEMRTILTYLIHPHVFKCSIFCVHIFGKWYCDSINEYYVFERYDHIVFKCHLISFFDVKNDIIKLLFKIIND